MMLVHIQLERCVPAIHLDELSFSYSSAAEVFHHISLHLGSGWTGVVGQNGAGKSTLLALVAGELSPSAGSLILDPRGARVVLCPQEVDSVTPEILDFTETTDGLARKWMGRLGIDPGTVDRWTTLSPGERKRFQLAAALASDPNILLLDEPTNHLDSDARRVVEGALARFQGVGLVISHDRAFLNRLTSRTLRVGAAAIRLWNAPYSVARAEWAAEDASMLEGYAAIRRGERVMRRRLADERRESDQRNAVFRRKTKKTDPKDHDARSMAAKGRHESGNDAGQRRRTVLRASMERAGEAAADLAPGKVFGGEIVFDFEPAPKRVLLRFSGPLRVESETLADDLDVAVLRDDRIRLIGPNGVGKSTLLKALMGGSGVSSDRLVYLPQELSRAEVKGLLERLEGLSRDRRGRVLSIVAALGVDPDVLLLSGRPSPGEARKLALALGLGGGAWGLILDEPTNHLDLPSVERVESALEAYPGALVLVTHDDTFGTRTTESIWKLESGRLSVSSVAPEG